MFKELFKRLKTDAQCAIQSVNNSELNDKYKHFDIEYLPHANRYFPRYKGEYLFWWSTLENYSTETDISGCVYSPDESGAKKHIDRFLELRGVETKIISVS